MHCCQNDYWELNELPFTYILMFDYYDGPLEGITSCSVCKQGFYYKLLEWDTSTLDSRIFAFSEISFTGEQLAENLGIKHLIRKNGGIVPPEYLNDFSFTPPPATHLCHSDTSFITGFWRKIMPNDVDVNNWIEYLGVVHSGE